MQDCFVLRGAMALPGAAGRPIDCLAVRCPGFLTNAQCALYAHQVYAARSSWTMNFGSQFTLGRAFYTHLEEGRADEYFASAAESDRLVEQSVPGLAPRMLTAAAALVGARVTPRRGWCGPGVHIFPGGGEVARRGGEVHFDTEGLRPEQLRRRARALTLILMLQRAERGGGLRVWDQTYDGDDFPRKPEPMVDVVQIDYAVGELVVIDSYRLHQILPFKGRGDRITATVHLVEQRAAWEAWF